jgi:hypothetical protein
MSSGGDDPPEDVGFVKFFGGPWDGKGARYFGLTEYPAMAATGGRYVFLEVDDDGSVVYVFEVE